MKYWERTEPLVDFGLGSPGWHHEMLLGIDPVWPPPGQDQNILSEHRRIELSELSRRLREE